MELKQRLDQRQVQRLILAPALQQAIKLLPLTNLELIEVIDTELSQNPMLELEEETIDKKEEDSTSKNKSDEEEIEKEQEKKLEEIGVNKKEDSLDNNEEIDYEAYFQDYFDNKFQPYFSEEKESLALENFVSKSISLWEHLNWQASLTFFDEQDKEISQYLIGNINKDGYLVASLQEIARKYDCSEQKVDEIRKRIMEFDPIGVGSLTLKESLITQMNLFQIDDEVTQRIIKNYLHILEKSDFAKLAKILGISLADLKPHIELIKRLEPAPGRKYTQEKTFYVVPDIMVSKEDDEYKIVINNEGLPRLKINKYYQGLLSKSLKNKPEAYKFLKDKMKKAFWFLQSLNQRNKTIYRVAEFIVNKQKAFLDKGIDYIKPLTLVELARDIGVHESTVGRVVANKYMLTPRGVYPLKYFFHKSLEGDFGEEISSLKVKERVKKLVENEDKNNPLSDIEIEDILAGKNLKVARRTVAKYRKQLNIPPSYIRKRKFSMEDA